METGSKYTPSTMAGIDSGMPATLVRIADQIMDAWMFFRGRWDGLRAFATISMGKDDLCFGLVTGLVSQGTTALYFKNMS